VQQIKSDGLAIGCAMIQFYILTWHTTGNFRDELPRKSLDWCKTQFKQNETVQLDSCE